MLNRDDGMPLFKRRVRAALVAALAVSLLSGCVMPGGVTSSEQFLAPNRAMVRVSAPEMPIAENYLMHQAAELTLRVGYTHFIIGEPDVRSRTTYIYMGDNYLHGPDYGRRAGLWPEYPNWPETHYSVSAEVRMLRPDEAAGNPQAIEALTVF